MVNGTKRTAGFAVTVLAVVLPLVGYSLSEVAPLQMARFADDAAVIVGLLITLYGAYAAKAPLWITKNK